MKRIVSWLFVVNALLIIVMVWFAIGNRLATDHAVEQPPDFDVPVQEVFRDDVILTMLMPYINSAVTGRYGTQNSYALQTAPYAILGITQPDPKMQHTFEVKVNVQPYANAHVTVGEDILTFEVSPGRIYLKEFLHVKDYPLPKHLQ
ncbi:MAG: DUF3888 domain-containing protein [Bacillota bacterium]|nr:DUF3888 domain-containing protein [Bacillota bacterium]MDW7685302.1 DUF3888 domain-containing protein [Bacillota bacterium]